MKIGVLTISDRSAAGERADEGGPLLARLMSPIGDVVETMVVPDEADRISATLIDWSSRVDLIVTTGGTGLGPRDVTPEATRAVIDREAPGLAEAMRAAGMRVTPFAALSRQVVGARGTCLIVNLPGAPKAVSEGIAAIIDILPHAVQMMRGGEPA